MRSGMLRSLLVVTFLFFAGTLANQLHDAIGADDYEEVNSLLQMKQLLNERGQGGQTPLMYSPLYTAPQPP